MDFYHYRENIIKEAERVFPDLQDSSSNIEYVSMIETLAADVSKTKRISQTSPIFEESLELVSQKPDEIKSIVEAGHSGLEKMRSGRSSEVTRKEATGLEAIIRLRKRPAIFVVNNKFQTPPEDWEILERYRENIETSILSVGRINVKGHPDLDWVGTGFLAGKDVIMTNEHVAIEFSRPNSNGRWTFKPGYSTSIDYGQDLSAENYEFNIEEVIGFHNQVDLALLRVSFDAHSSSMNSPHKPLTIAKDFDDNKVKDRKVYVIGFPAYDSRSNLPAEMQRIFLNTFGVKRLQPGTLLGFSDTNIINHDCSTLGGNSGSCVVDIETNKVLGLHFSGKELVANKAVALWKLTDDPLLKSSGIQFG